MDVFLYASASAGIVVLLLAMCWRCLGLLGWLPKRLAPPLPAAQSAEGAVPRWELPCWALAALACQWVVLLAAHCLVHGGADGFFAAVWTRFTTSGDSPHYLWLAENGYTTDAEHINRIVFYPLYPLLLRMLRPLFGGSTALAGMVLSQLCFAGALALMRGLTAQYLPRSQARAATAALLLYPFSFFSVGVYTEGLFLLLSIGCLYALARQRPGVTGTLALLAALCRTQGLALFFACLFAFLQAPRRRGPLWAWALAGAPLGYGVYLLLNRSVTGQWFGYLYYQSIAPWYNHADWFGANIAQQYGMALAYPGLARYIYIPQIVLYYLGLAALLWLFWRGTAPAAAVYSTAYFGMSYLSGWLISGGRYMFGCLGLFLALGSVRSRPLRCLLLGGEGLLLLVYAVYYRQGQAIM